MFTEKVGYPLGSTCQARFEMDEEVFNIQLRKFLKKVGIQSQREIEQAVRSAISADTLDATETLTARVVLQVPAVGIDVTIEDTIKLS
ncbi:MAG: hypothetical protein KAG66_02705 [Methylococcales bacterium]|jgi:hypothetical protein|nr:hypothetical protein [Methylococcales bacterium]